jgi:hypothetical protein
MSLNWEMLKSGLCRATSIATSAFVLAGLVGCTNTPTNTSSPSPPSPSQVTNTSTTPSIDTGKQLLGQWQGKAEGKDLTLIFTPEGKMFALLQGERQTFELFYKLDTTTNPLNLDVSLKDETTKTILEFTSEGQLRIQLEGANPKTPRPTSFNAKASILKKTSDSTELPKSAQLTNPFEQHRLRAIQSEGKTYIAALNRSSQAYYIEKDSFTDEIDKLGLGIQKETKNYSYSLVLLGDRKAVQTLAIAKSQDIKSYTGLVYVSADKNNELSTKTILCESDRPTTEKAAAPEVANDEAKCPSGYSQKQRW